MLSIGSVSLYWVVPLYGGIKMYFCVISTKNAMFNYYVAVFLPLLIQWKDLNYLYSGPMPGKIRSFQYHKTIILWEDMSLLAMNSLCKKGHECVPVVQRINVNAVCHKDNYFPKRKFKLPVFNSLFHSVCLVFFNTFVSYCNMFAVHHMWKHMQWDRCFLWHIATSDSRLIVHQKARKCRNEITIR